MKRRRLAAPDIRSRKPTEKHLNKLIVAYRGDYVSRGNAAVDEVAALYKKHGKRLTLAEARGTFLRGLLPLRDDLVVPVDFSARLGIARLRGARIDPAKQDEIASRVVHRVQHAREAWIKKAAGDFVSRVLIPTLGLKPKDGHTAADDSSLRLSEDDLSFSEMDTEVVLEEDLLADLIDKGYRFVKARGVEATEHDVWKGDDLGFINAAQSLSPTIMFVWRVSPDDLVCPICSDLEGEVYTSDEAETISLDRADAAHCRCRCWFDTVVGADSEAVASFDAASFIAAPVEWDESKHPRDKGKFTFSDGGDSGGEPRLRDVNAPMPKEMVKSSLQKNPAHYEYLSDLNNNSRTEYMRVTNYTGRGYEDVNNLLRDDGNKLSPKDYNAAVKDSESITKTINDAPPLKEPIVVWRGLSGSAARDIWKDAEKGDIVKMNGFQSCTTDTEVLGAFADQRGAILRIETTRGLDVRSASEVPGEHEFLLGHGWNYEVTRTDDEVTFPLKMGGKVDGSVRVISLRVIRSDSPPLPTLKTDTKS